MDDVMSLSVHVFDCLYNKECGWCNVLHLLVGLEAQLLGIVVRKERPDLEEQKDSLVRSIAAGKKKLVELEDEILRSVSLSISTDLYL